MKQMGAGHFAPEPKRPMQERPEFFLKRPNYVSRVPQVHFTSAPNVSFIVNKFYTYEGSAPKTVFPSGPMVNHRFILFFTSVPK